MNVLLRLAFTVVLAAAASGCSLSNMLGGGGKSPPTLLILTPEAAAPGEYTRAAGAGETLSIRTPEVSNELSTVRVPAYVPPNDVAYIQDLQLVDRPHRLLRDLLAETVRRRTSRVVLDPGQTALDPGLLVSGRLQRFGYDAQTGQVVVTYDASLTTAGTRVETRRFEGSAPADGTAATVGPALNRAANQVAFDFADWIAR